MDSLGQLLAYGVGAICLGIALTMAALFVFSGRRSPDHSDSGEGCFITVLVCTPLVMAGFFFFLAVSG